MRTTAAVASAAALLLLLTACSDGAEPAAGSSPETGELQAVRVGTMPIVDAAPIRLGVEEGIFAEHGLELELTDSGQGGAATIPGVVSGDVQFGFSNTPALLSAVAQGLELSILAPAAASTGVAGEDTAGIVVPAGSDVSSPADLAGRLVAVNTLRSIGDSTVRETVELAGGDPEAIEFIEIAFPDILAALADGRVEAAWVVEPFLTLAQEQGAELLASNYVETSPTLLIAAYFTSSALLESDPDLVTRFTAAMEESQAFAEQNPERVREVLDSFMQIDPAVAASLVLPRFPDTVDREDVEFLVDFTYRQGITETELDAASLLP